MKILKAIKERILFELKTTHPMILVILAGQTAMAIYAISLIFNHWK